MSSCFSAFKAALIAALKADSGVAAIVGANVYDEVDRVSAVAPWVYLGPMGYRELAIGGAAFEARLRVYCVSTKFDRDGAWTLHDAVRKALANTVLSLSGGHVASDLRVMAGGDVTIPNAPKEVFVDLMCSLSDADAGAFA